MSKTSLAEQLQKLRTPQISQLYVDKRKHSLLFDAKEAAALDREDVYKLGLKGLKELIELNPQFKFFENNLFDQTSISLEREMQTKKVNKKLDKKIKKFLYLLSPYFLLKPAHKALEWLIHRFSIQKYNMDDFFKLILPYHDTHMFVKVLRLFKIDQPDNKWQFLKPLQRSEFPLSKLTLFTHCASDLGFLKFVCQMTEEIVQEFIDTPKQISTLFAFYCTTLIGTIQHSEKVQEEQLAHILSILIQGLNSENEQFTSSNLMILAALLRKATLSLKVLEKILIILSKFKLLNLKSEYLMVIILIFQSQYETIKHFPQKALNRFYSKEWLPEMLNEYISLGVYLDPLISTLIEDILTSLQLNIEENENIRLFAINLIQKINMNNEMAAQVIGITIDHFQDEIFESNPSKNYNNPLPYNIKNQNLFDWYSEFIRQLERRFPLAFDSIVKSATDARRHRLNILLGLVQDFPLHLTNNAIFDNLVHPNSKIRLPSLKFISVNYEKLRKNEKEMIFGAISDILADNDVYLIHSVLDFKEKALLEIFGREKLFKHLLSFVYSCWIDQETWKNVTPRVLELLCSDLFRLSDISETQTLLAILPFLLDKKMKNYSSVIFTSHFFKNNTFFDEINKDILNPKNSQIYEIISNHLMSSKNIPSLSILKELASKELTIVDKYLITLLLGGIESEQALPYVSKNVIEILMSLFESSMVNNGSISSESMKATDSEYLESVKMGCYPFPVFFQTINNIIKVTQVKPFSQDFGNWIDLSDLTINGYLLKLFEILLEGINRSAEQQELRVYYIKSLKLFFDQYFPSRKARLNFLANIFITHELITSQKHLSFSLQFVALKLANTLLRKENIQVIQWICSNKSIFVPALLIASTCSIAPIRHEAVNILEYLAETKCSSKYNILIQMLSNHFEGLKLDSQHLSFALYSILSPDPAVRSLFKRTEATQLDDSLKCLITLITNYQETPLHISGALLDILSNVNSFKLVFVPISKLIDYILKDKDHRSSLNYYQSRIIINIINRFNEDMISYLDENIFSQCLERFLSEHKTTVLIKGKPTPICVPMMNQISQTFYGSLPEPFRKRSLKTIIKSATETTNSEAVYASRRLLKRIYLDGDHASEILNIMLTAQLKISKIGKTMRSITTCPAPETLNTLDWKQGITLLENIQKKKKINSREILLTTLFNLLKKCLEFEEQAPVEYTKQLVLTSIHQCCSNPNSLEQMKALNIEPVVECIRGSKNPQTHHHALLLLTQLTHFIPDDVLLHIMSIFTFMGSSVIRQDDNYSFTIISQIIDNIFPYLIRSEKSKENPTQVEQTKIGVLRVFADALIDIPVHRRMFLYQKIITTLGIDQTLWLIISLVVENQVTHDANQSQEKQEFILNFALSFEPKDVLLSCTSILKYLQTLPLDKDEFLRKYQKSLNIFDITNHSDKQMRHFRYALSTFICSLLSATQFLEKVASLSSNDTDKLIKIYQSLIETSLEYIQNVGKISELSIDKSTNKYWRSLLNVTQDILDKINALLPREMLISMLGFLLKHPSASLRRKSMELLNARLTLSYFVTTEEKAALVSLVDPLFKVVCTIKDNAPTVQTANPTEKELNQMTALVSLKLLSRILDTDNIKLFIPVVDLISSVTSNDFPRGNMLASLLLCLSDLCHSLRAHSLPYISKFMPVVITCLKRENQLQNPDLITISIITSIHKLLETLANFLSPYLNDLIYEISIMSMNFTVNEKDSEQTNKTPIMNFELKLKSIRQKVASDIPGRVLIPVISNEFQHLLETKSYKGVGAIMEILKESFGHMSSTELNHLHNELSAFFIKALDYRSDIWSKVLSSEENVEYVSIVEDSVINTLVSYVLKLSESSFKPFFLNLFFWATNPEASVFRPITFYKLTEKIASNLQGLFVLFAGHIIKHASEQLNNLKDPVPIFEVSDCVNKTLLLEGLLKTLYLIFLYDSQQFINKERFQLIMQPLVDQLDNMCGGPSELEKRAKEFIIPALAQFAVAAADDSLWKLLNYQILLKMRHSLAQVRLAALQAITALATSLGQDFFPLLPETIPFLAELLEDENESVEKACHKSIQELEDVLGEPLKKYF